MFLLYNKFLCAVNRHIFFLLLSHHSFRNFLKCFPPNHVLTVTTPPPPPPQFFYTTLNFLDALNCHLSYCLIVCSGCCLLLAISHSYTIMCMNVACLISFHYPLLDQGAKSCKYA